MYVSILVPCRWSIIHFYAFQSEQQVRYAADGSGYHGAVSVNTNSDHHEHTANVAVGQKAVELSHEVRVHFSKKDDAYKHTDR